MTQLAHSVLRSPAMNAEPARGRLSPWPPAESVERRLLPHLDPTTRFFVRVFVYRARRRVIEIRGLEFIHPDNDPFVVVANHSQRAEAVMLPALLMWHRNGRRFTTSLIGRACSYQAWPLCFGQPR